MDKLKRNFILNTMFQVLRLLSPLVVTPYVSRVLGVEGIGLYSYTYSIEYYFFMFAILGTTAYGAREISRHRDEPEKMSHIFWEIWLLNFITSLISIGAWSVVVFTGGQNQLYFAILTFFLLSAMVDITWFYTGLERFPIIVVRNMVVKVVEIALVFLLVKKAEHLYLYFLIMAGGAFLGNGSLWLGMRKNLTKVDRKSLRPLRHMRENMIFFLPTIATSVYTVVGKTLIGAITRSESESGIYEQTTKIVEIIKAVAVVSLNTVLGPRNSYLHKRGELQQIKTNIRGSLDFILLMSIGACCGVIGVAELFVPWFFGTGYDAVVQLLRVLSPIVVIIGISYTLGSQYYEPVGLRLKSAKYLVVGACCSIVFNLVLIPSFKSLGAVIGSLVAEAVIAILYVSNCDGFMTWKELLRICWKKVIAGAVMALLLLWQAAFLKPVTTHVILLVGLGIGVYFLCLLVLADRIVIQTLQSGLKKVKSILSKRKG